MQAKGVLVALTQMYDDCIQCFRIDESTLAFSSEDVALIMGLCCDGDAVVRKYHIIVQTCGSKKKIAIST